MRNRLRSTFAASAIALSAALIAPATAPSPAEAQTSTSTDTVRIDLADLGEPATQRASGFIYGLTEDGTNPPDIFLTEMGFRFTRAGGAQLASPGGWVRSIENYERRWASTVAQYRRTKSLGGEFILLPHDLWGADGSGQPIWPGDDGDWTLYDAFLDRLVADIKADGLEDVQFDIWNEPDLNIFWARPQQQYLQLWQRTHEKLRDELPATRIVGPSTAADVNRNSSWWNTYMDFIAEHDAVPDIFSWHEIGGGTHGQDPVGSLADARFLLDERGLSVDEFQVNEYGWPADQNPGKSAWFISRLERGGIDGLRSNWGSGAGLHDNLGDLVAKSPTGYQPLADWFVYRAYNTQRGRIAATDDGDLVDAFATVAPGGRAAHVLVGNKSGATGQVSIDIAGLRSTKLVRDDRVRAVVQRIAYDGGARSNGPQVELDSVLAVDESGQISIGVDYTDEQDAFFITLLPPQAASTFDGNLQIDGGTLSSGTTNTVTATFTNDGLTPMRNVSVDLDAPDGWSLRPASATSWPLVHRGQTVTATFEVDVPSGLSNTWAAYRAEAGWQNGSTELGTDAWLNLHIPCGVGDLCEAENGALHGGACVESNHPGFTGTGFVACLTVANRGVTIEVAAPDAGSYNLLMRYSAGPHGPTLPDGEHKTMSVAVNDGPYEQVLLPVTETWQEWAETVIDVDLEAGRNSVEVSFLDTDTGWINIDHFIVEP